MDRRSFLLSLFPIGATAFPLGTNHLQNASNRRGIVPNGIRDPLVFELRYGNLCIQGHPRNVRWFFIKWWREYRPNYTTEMIHAEVVSEMRCIMAGYVYLDQSDHASLRATVNSMTHWIESGREIRWINQDRTEYPRGVAV